MRLHDLHIASLGGDGQTLAPAWQMAMEANFGTLAAWREAFAQCAAAGSGWALLAFEPSSGRLVHRWQAGPELQAPDTVPLLALELSGPAGLESFLRGIDWAAVYERYQAAVHEASEPLAASQEELRGQRLLDVRRAGVYAQAGQLIEGAQWRDPAQVAQWSSELSPTEPVVVYCIYGHEVGRATALRLRAAGLNARFLRGGIDAWTAAGRPLMDKPAP